jgi:2-keto-4-pentenoate hydratase/2-oxohepta-3-ene-1,7-dioic acid hydratase in catechol pathway
VVPKDSTGSVEYEGGLVAAIGRRARDLSEAEALSCVAGFTLANRVAREA